jgi:hypothetical protein
VSAATAILGMEDAIVVRADPVAICAVREFFAKHPRDEVIAPYVAATCGLDALPAMAALCFLLEAGEIEVDVGHQTWTWQFRRSRRGAR